MFSNSVVSASRFMVLLALLICGVFVAALSIAPGSQYNLVGEKNTQYAQVVLNAASTLPVLCAQNDNICAFFKPFKDAGRSVNRFVRNSVFNFYATWWSIHNFPARILSWF